MSHLLHSQGYGISSGAILTQVLKSCAFSHSDHSQQCMTRSWYWVYGTAKGCKDTHSSDANTRFVAIMSEQFTHLGHKIFHAWVGKTNTVKPGIHLLKKAWRCALNAAAREDLPPLLLETFGESVEGGHDATNAKKHHWGELMLYQEPNVPPIEVSANLPGNPSLSLLPNLNEGPVATSGRACHQPECLCWGVKQRDAQLAPDSHS